MFEVITADGKSVYQGANWVRAIAMFYNHVSLREHVVLWEGEEPVREFHPTLGHYADGEPPKDDINANVA